MVTLYGPNGQPLEFSERNELLTEIATRSAAGEVSFGQFGLLPDPDPVLNKSGDGPYILETLSADYEVCSSIQKRKLQTLNRDNYGYHPGHLEGEEPTDKARALCAELATDLGRLNVRNIISQLLDSPYYGYTVAELYWESVNGRLRLANVQFKPRRWFSWNDEHEFVFLQNGVEKLVPPVGKFLVAQHFPTDENPYGLRLLSRCLWPCAFKRGGIEFWTRFGERYGQPWVLAKVGQNEDPNRLAGMLRAMVQDAVAVIKGGGEIDVHEVSGKGEVHQRFVSHWDGVIAKLLQGQTLTSDDGSGKGSYALSQTHYAVLQDYADADVSLVVSWFDELGKLYAQVNKSDAAAPAFRFIDPEDKLAEIEIDKGLHGLGVRFTDDYITRKYGLAEGEFTIAGETGQSDPNAESSTEHTEFAEFADAGQDGIDAWLDELMPDAVTANRAFAQRIIDAVQSAESFDDMQILLAELLGDRASTHELEDLIARVMVNGQLYGQESAND